MKILIVVVRYVTPHSRELYEFPLGLAYISAAVKNAGHQVDVLNLNHYNETQAMLIYDTLTQNKYDCVLTGGLSAHYRQIKSIVDDVRLADTKAVVIIGGGVMSATPGLMYRYIKPDYIVIGEGETTIVELLNEIEKGGKDYTFIKGLGWVDSGGNLAINPGREPIADLDTLPWPDFDGFGVETYLDMQLPNHNLYMYKNDKPRFIPIISSRGCPFRCTFCFHPLGQKYRSRSVDGFIAEVEYLMEKYNVNNLAVFDELLSTDRARLLEICARLKPLDVNWECQMRVDNVDGEILAAMKDAGCFLISYGLESASDKVLESMDKRITLSQIDKALDLTRQAGIGVQGYFIFGDPAETVQTAYETLEFWEMRRDFHITMGYIRPYPGTTLWVEKMAGASDERQLEYIDKCVNEPPNMTGMNQAEWFELQKDVQKALIQNEHSGVLIGSTSDTITVRCPHCGRITQYRNFHQRILGVFKMACRVCNQQFNMTPLAFVNVQNDYARNNKVYQIIKKGRVPVTVTPCMNEAEFAAMSEVYLNGAKIQNFMDIDDNKTGKQYMGKKILKRTATNINKDSYYLIPLTRYADGIFKHLQVLGVASDRICRLDEVIV